jgi:hypothetical protein
LTEEGAETYTVFAVPKSDGGEVAYGYTLLPYTGKPTAEEAAAAIRSASSH